MGSLMTVHITPEYEAQLKTMHSTMEWGKGNSHKTRKLIRWSRRYGWKTVLDYGCGQGNTKTRCADWSDLHVDEYDPGIPGKDSLPEGTWDVLFCADVMEHVEPALIDDTLALHHRIARHAFYIIPRQAASQTLPDGRNAHLTQEGAEWWRERLEKHWKHVRQVGYKNPAHGYAAFICADSSDEP
jgi:hypothetical protein